LEPLKIEYKCAEQINPGELFASSTANIETNNRLREPQRDAHKAIREHFQKSNTPAIVQIPVGCGKTGIIATLPFGIVQGRVLVIAPNTTIRKGIAEALDVGHPKFFLAKQKFFLIICMVRLLLFLMDQMQIYMIVLRVII